MLDIPIGPNPCFECGGEYGAHNETCSQVSRLLFRTHQSRVAAEIETAVCEDIKARQRKGVAKYGLTVASNPLSQRDWLIHAYEEALDLAIYLKRIIECPPPK